MYEALRHEPVKNLPFNCDGCTRVLPRLAELGSTLSKQNIKLLDCEKKVNALKEDIEKIVELKVENAIVEFREREQRKCNIIVHNVPESGKKETDAQSLRDIFKNVQM